MKKILKNYIDTLREIKRLEEKKKELIKQLLLAKTLDGEELGDIVLNSRCHGREIIIENLPDDVDDDELWMKSNYICDELYFLKREVEIAAGRMCPENYGYGSPDGHITDGSHEGW